ncbi:MAG: hypothetical protein FD156_680 [Nitrospirae bacterium]|nr:MAG: hypothetical protein FD156_680 [Nitrospirota bacterium]
MSQILLKEDEMKKLVIVLTVLFVFSASAYAQMGMMGEQKGEMKQQGMMDEAMMKQMMPMMEKCQQMMKSIGGGTMMQDMMQMMMNMMNMQEKMMMGAKPSDKKQMMKDMAQMKEKMHKMMSINMGMMTGAGDSQAKLKCAEQWLKKAIDLHEIHIKDPKTATEASQMEMMDQMKHAYECIAGGPSEKTEPHKH